MARGISSADVNDVADMLLAAGERPTAERVRLALGRGSPNTIGPMLETWWGGLAQRLRVQLALPGVPEELGSAFAHLWAQALAAGKAHAEGLVAPERAALAEALARTDAAAAERDAALQQAHAALQAAERALAQSEHRVGDLQREIATLATTAADLGKQREAVEARLLIVLARADQDRTAAAAERDRLQALLRQVEDRAYGEVDRTRQELKALKAQLATQARDHTVVLKKVEKERLQLQAQLHKAQSALATARSSSRAASATKRTPVVTAQRKR